MKAKLIHRGNGDYKLYVNGATYAQSAPNPHRKLSKQNCDEIFGLVDVEKLDRKIRGLMMINGTSSGTIDHPNTDKMISLFNKAMELNKDKVFTIDDMRKAFNQNPAQTNRPFNEFIQSLRQPTEIDVEIETKKVVDETKIINSVKGVKGSGHKITTYKSIPKLDSEGCLILKKI
jgi:hypothetical protein